MTGKVWLVGAGPGDPGLLTLKARRALSEADVVVYDALVGPGVLGMIPDTARLIFAGKRSSHHYMKQSDTNRVLLEEALAGNNVVRLKGGDPFLFGRGGEELELLSAHGVPFEVVPGVTSAFAVPAYCGIPVTHRDCCSSVHVITGHRREGQDYDIDFDALVRTGGTLVFLMGVAALHDIAAGLMRTGMSPDTPAAVLEKGTTARQRRIGATVSTLAAECEKRKVQTPAIIVVGAVCALAETFSWYEKRPLAGVRVLLTRPKELSSRMAALLRADGAEVLELPAIRTEPLPDDEAMRDSLQTLQKGGYDWLVFTSPSGVRIFFRKLMELSDIRALGSVRVAAIGQGSEKALRAFGVKADFVPSVFDGETLGRELRQVCKPGEKLLVPRARIGNQALIDELRKGGGLTVTDLPTYDTAYASSPVIDEKAALTAGEIDYAVFTSASTVKGFAEAVGEMDYSTVKAVCIGRQTALAAAALGMQVRVAEKATLASLADCLRTCVTEDRANKEEKE